MTKGLKLNSGVAANFSASARKSYEVPELKTHVLQGNISIHQARRVTSVITAKNKKKWLIKATTHSQRQLEREVSLVIPKMAIHEKCTYVSSQKEVTEKVKVVQKVPRVQLQVGVSEKIMIRLRRVQDLESQRIKSHASLEETMDQMISTYLNKYDPMEKAKRQKIRGKLAEKTLAPQKNEDLTESENFIGSENQATKTVTEGVQPEKPLKKNRRQSIPAKVRHQVRLRDADQCTHLSPTGEWCGVRRFLHFHHLREVSRGGGDTVKNLTLLCVGHHRGHHL